MTKSGIDLVIFRRFSATLPCVSYHSTFDYSASLGLINGNSERDKRRGYISTNQCKSAMIVIFFPFSFFFFWGGGGGVVGSGVG